MNTELTPNKTSLRVRRDEEGNEQSATLTVTDDTGNTVTLRYENTNALRDAFGRFWEEQKSEAAEAAWTALDTLDSDLERIQSETVDASRTFLNTFYDNFGVTRAAVRKARTVEENTEDPPTWKLKSPLLPVLPWVRVLPEFQYEMGLKAKDTVTGFEGRIVARCEHITGCDTYCIQPENDGSKFEEGRWFDEQRLNISRVKKLVLDNSRAKGPVSSASDRNHPSI